MLNHLNKKQGNFQLLRCNKRKRIALQVKDNQVIVKAPYAVPIAYIENLVWQKRNWIEKVLIEQQQAQHLQNKLHDNGQLWLFGELIPISVQVGEKANVNYEQRRLVITLCLPKNNISPVDNLTRIKKAIEQWLKQQAELILSEKIAVYSQQMSMYPSSLAIRQYKARWGSCDNTGQIKLNYLLMMLPHWVIDYVVVHELCHLKHLNHSREFWQLVGEYQPDYMLAKKWLRDHQHSLVWPKISHT
ncbi:M48 family metallopeptidase [Thalassotalea sediminis]|uniref:M48 family metallopeptidase n=1 Tax=Thalassotalea sediminis TaxID=1759089 RepID=UPI0025724CEA|nr:SprT family zinc-dependent metalloprotease [Thalassotalea sediminis]